MYTINDTFEANGITNVIFDISKDGNRRVLMFDCFGKKSVLDHRHYAGIFAAVFAAVRPGQPTTLNFALDGWGWHIKATPDQGVDLDAAYDAFIAALNHPD